MRDGTRVERMMVRGAVILFLAAFIWGIGNAVTGLTAQKYASVDSLLPGVDIALANTIGGLSLVAIVMLISIVTRRFGGFSRSSSEGDFGILERLGLHSILAGALKGANTCLFVFSTVYIVATRSLIFESTYILWSLILAGLFLKRIIPVASALLKALALFLAVVLVSIRSNTMATPSDSLAGSSFGLLAGLTYAFYLFFWSFVTRNLETWESRVSSTALLLAISMVTILLLTEGLALTLLHKWWTPFASLEVRDTLVQAVNGVFVIGVVYLLITVGMSLLKDVREGAGFVTALSLSFSIPFTLLAEFAIGKFVPAGVHLVGVLLFMVGFVLMSDSLSEGESTSSLKGGQE